MADKSRSSRLTSYKNAGLVGPLGSTDLRRKRAELSVTLRKQAREDQLLKRRALSPDSGDLDSPTDPTEVLPTPEEIVQGLKAGDLNVKLTSARAARRMLSREQNPPIDIMIRAGIIKPLVEALNFDNCSDLQFEAAWALTNIASGTRENTLAVVDGGAIPRLVTLLARGGTVGEQSAWAIGNIAGDGAETRDVVLSHGLLPALLVMMTPSTPPSQLRTAVWTYSNLCRNKNPLVQFDKVSAALPYVSKILDLTDVDVLADACWALSYLTDGPNERIELVQRTDKLLPRLIKLLSHDKAAVKTPALRAVGNMITGEDTQTEACLDAGCLPPLCALLRSGKSALVKEAAWAVSNVLAGTHAQIQRAIDANALTDLVHVISTGDARCQKEAAFAINNLCLGGNTSHLDALLQAGALQPFCSLLESNDNRTIAVVLEGLLHLLTAANNAGHVEALAISLEEMGALDRLEALQNHENEKVYELTRTIIDTYFAENDEDESAAPTLAPDEYNFAAAPPSQQTFQF